ncbi:MAG TPA: glycosyltransferase 87 family protein, partial [Anaerolineaceae bacterium]
PSQWLILALLFALVFGTLTVAAHTVFQNNTPGIDYYVYWVAGRAFFNHQDPYSARVMQAIQMGIYGHLADPNENKMPFANPPYAFFILLPFLWLDFGWSQAAWMSFNILLVLSLSYILFPHAPKWIRISFAFLYPFVFGYILGNFVVTISALLLIFLGYLVSDKVPSRGMQIILGMVIAWTTVKPQFIWAFLLLFLLFGLRQRLWRMLSSFAASLTLMATACLVYRPDWIGRWLQQLTAYQNYNDTLPILSRYLRFVLPDTAVPYAFYGLTAAALGVAAYLLLRWWMRQCNPLVLIAWLGLVTYLIHPGGGGGVSYEQLVFLIPVFIWGATQKPSLETSLTWAGFWIAATVCNAGTMLKTPAWFELLIFPLYILWTAWIMARPVRLPAVTQLKPTQT